MKAMPRTMRDVIMFVAATIKAAVILARYKFSFVLVLLFSNAFAEYSYYGNYSWRYRIINGDEAEIYGEFNWDTDRVDPAGDSGGDVIVPPILAGFPVTSIGEDSFASRYRPTSVAMPTSVTHVASSAFIDCATLDAVYITDLTSWCHIMFDSNYANPLYYAHNLYLNGTLITDLEIPNDVMCIKAKVFCGCSSLQNVMIHDRIKEIGDYAFYNCSGITNLVLPSAITSIEHSTFRGCVNLTRLVLPSNVTNIEDYAFYGCSGLMSVSIPNSVKRIGKYAFYGCSSLKEVIIPKSLEIIEDCAFYGCSGLTNVSIENGVRRIGKYSFHGCSGLTNVTIPNSLLYIGDYAFDGCSSVERVTFFGGFKDIGFGAFYCDGLRNGNVYSSNYLNVQENGFPYGVNLVLFKENQIVAFDANGIDVVFDPMTVRYGSVYGTLPLLTRTGYSFCGWNYNQDNISETNTVFALDDHTLVAQWKINQYRVTFDASGGVGCVTNEQDYASEIVVPEALREGYTFLGWSPEVDATVPASNVAYTAQWRINQYSVVFDANDGTGNITNEQNYASEIVAPDVARDGYTFLGWSPEVDATVPASNVTYTAQWKINQYMVAFDANGGSGSVTNELDYASEIIAPTVTREGCSFEGWSPKVDLTVPASNVTYVARWKIWSVGVDSTKLSIRQLYPNDYQNITNVILALGMTEIPSQFFAGCTALESVEIPTTVTNIGAFAFADCRSLKHITIPDSVINIGDGAFDGCTGLVSATLPLPEEPNPPEPGFYEAKFTGLNSLDGGIGIIDNAENIKISAEKLYSNIDEYVMYAYGAYMYLQEDVTYWFSACYDNFVTIKLDENLLISPHDWYYGDQTASASFQSSGWHWIELRVYNSNDVGGPSGNGVYWWTNENTARHSFADPGDCSLFVTKQPPKEATLREIFPNSFDKLVSVTLTGGAKSIPKGFFSGCATLTSVTLPEDIKRIGVGAFDGCISLTSINLPDTLTDWGLESLPPAMRNNLSYDSDGFIIYNGWLLDYQNKNASSLVVPEGIVGIGVGALAGMYDLETVTLPQSLKYIAEGAFREDTYLDNLVIPDGVEIIGDRAFEDCSFIQTMTLGKGVKSVGTRAFAGCTQLSGAVFADGLLDVGALAFNGCWRMQSVSLPLSTTNVASSAFSGCMSLTGVTTPTHGGKMSEWFAPVYSQIRDVTVPEGEMEVRASMFEGCGSLQTVQMPDSITNIAARAFYGCSSLPEVRLPESLMAVGGETFRNCLSLTAAALPENVTCIGARAFQGCSNLSALTLPRGLESLPDYVFADCWSLDSFVVPAAVTNLGNYIVSGSTTAIYYLGNAPAYGANVYGNASGSLKSYVILGTKGWDGRPNSRDIPASWNGRDILTWSANQFDVTFDANGGLFFPVVTNTYACEEITYTGYSLPPFEPVRKGMDFDGYWTEPNGGTRVFTSTQVLLTKPHTLYSHWKKGATIKVRFNACGGTVLPAEDDYVAERPYCELPVPVREHFAFAGWWTEASGGSCVEISSEVPKAAHELFAHWTPASYKIRFHANNGTDETIDQYFTYGDAVTLRANSFGYDDEIFVGWALSEGGPAVYADGKTLTDVAAIQDTVIHLYAVWVSTRYTVRFDSHGGVGRMENQTLVIGVAQNLAQCSFARDGYKFAGWALSTTSAAIYRDGERVKDLSTSRNAAVVLYAVWVVPGRGGDGWTACDVSFDAQGGTVDMDFRTITSGAELETLPQPSKVGCEFDGWFTSPDGGSRIAENTVVTMSVRYYARWKSSEPVVVPELYDEMEAVAGEVPATAASEYNGYLYDEGGAIKGTIQVKVGKPNAKTGLASIKATVVVGAAKKKSLKAADNGKAAIAEDGPTTIALVGGDPCVITLGTEGLSGAYGSYQIDGARNFFSSKDKGEQGAANELLAKWLGPANVVWDGGTVSVSIGKKGKAKVAVLLADGTKATANAQLLIGEEWLCVPVVVTKKMNLAFTLWLPRNGGAALVDGLSGDVVVGKPGALRAGAKFGIDAEAFSARWGQRALPYLPDGMAVTQSGAKWTLPKAGKVQKAKDGTIDSSKLGENPSALKLTYKAKDGSFKGSFKVYADNGGKLKATTVNVTGVVIDGVGYGTATIKKVGSVPVKVE